MARLFIALTLVIVVILGSVFGILFTKPGNNLIAGYIENKVNGQRDDVNLKVNDFVLTFSTINFNATISDNSTIDVSGDLELFSKRVDLKYDVQIKDLSKLENLVNQKLNGSFSTSGTFKGDQESAVIDGISTVASSDTKYNIKLANFEPSNIFFTMKNAKIDELLYMVNQPKFAKGNLNINANIKNAKLGSLDGTVVSSISKGSVVNDVANKAFNQKINVPITFKSHSNATLEGNLINIKSEVISNLAKLTAQKSVIEADTAKVTSDYALVVDNLAKLESIIGMKLNGKLQTSGDVVVNNGIIKVDGKSDIFESLTKYSVKVANAKPEYAKFNIADAKIEKLLYFVNQPRYATGKINIDGDVKNANIPTLDGLITTKITNGKVVNKVVNKQFNQKLKSPITFTGDVNTKLVPNQAVSKANIVSSMANVIVSNAVFDLKEASLNSDYLVKISDLGKLKDVTGQKMRGKLDLNGNISSKGENLLVTGASKLLGGALDFKLNNNDFKANVKDVEVKQLTHMMFYPEVFDSKSALSLNYNLLSKKGQIKGNLLKGHFLPNDFSGLINQFAKFDLTREIYDIVDINSDINNMVLKTVVKMKSKNTQIDVIRSILDLNKTYVDAKIKAQIRKLNLDFDVSGNTKNPKVKLNTKNLLKNKIEEKINDKIGDKIKDKIGGDAAKDLLKLFN